MWKIYNDGAAGMLLSACLISMGIAQCSTSAETFNAITVTGSAAINSNLFVGGAVQSPRFINTGNNTNLGRNATAMGGISNTASSANATVGGGGMNVAGGVAATIGGGGYNVATGGLYATIGGGCQNMALGDYATVAGGRTNTAMALASVGGGVNNTATGAYAAVAGGFQNVAGGQYATVPGGRENKAWAPYSLAAGCRAQALHQGAFVLSDAQSAVFTSHTNNQFNARFRNGYRLVTDGTNDVIINNGTCIAASFTGNGSGLTKLHGAAIQPGTIGLAALNMAQMDPRYVNATGDTMTGPLNNSVSISVGGITLQDGSLSFLSGGTLNEAGFTSGEFHGFLSFEERIMRMGQAGAPDRTELSSDELHFAANGAATLSYSNQLRVNLRNRKLLGHWQIESNLTVNGRISGDGAGLINLPVAGLTTNAADERYVNAVGDTMGGTLNVTSLVNVSSISTPHMLLLSAEAGIKVDRHLQALTLQCSNSLTVGAGCIPVPQGYALENGVMLSTNGLFAPSATRTFQYSPPHSSYPIYVKGGQAVGDGGDVFIEGGRSHYSKGGNVILRGGDGGEYYGGTNGDIMAWGKLYVCDAYSGVTGTVLHTEIFDTSTIVRTTGATLTGPLVIQSNMIVCGSTLLAYIPPQGDLSMGIYTNRAP